MVTAAVMKWIGRSLVERAAAAAYPSYADTVPSNKIAAQLSAVIGHSKLAG
jgi:hypothetical protein